MEYLLSTCNDGRRKTLFCLAVNLLELSDVRAIVEQLMAADLSTTKERAVYAAALLQKAADEKGISLAAICLEGCVIVLACVIFSAFATTPPAIADNTLAAATIVWNYVGEVIFNMLVLGKAIPILLEGCPAKLDRGIGAMAVAI